ncbi:MAG: carboxypeptidase-like regulatory domain-containing protein [Planctomycetota bacterium]
MRVVLALAAAAFLGLVIWWAGSAPADLGPLPPGENGSPGEIERPGESTSNANDDTGAPRAEAMALQPARVPDGLADEVTAVLAIVDADSSLPVENAAIYRIRESDLESAIAYTDARGLAPLPLGKPAQLMVVRAGYLLRLSPTRPGSTAEAPQVVRLVPDRYSTRGPLRFRLPGGDIPADVCVTLSPLREDRSDQAMPESVRIAKEDVQRAWREQRTLSAVRAVPELHVQLGFHNAAFVHVLRGDDEVAFAETGRFLLLAATPDGFVARRELDTAEFARGPMTIQLDRGAALAGLVRSQDGSPVEGAYVAVRTGDPLRLVARSGGDGAFTIGPLGSGDHTLEIRHRDHETAQAGPFATGPAVVEVRLVPLPSTAVRGRIVGAGTGAPVRGASAALLVPNGEPVIVEADAEGYFAARTVGGDSLRLNVGAEGYVTHSELVAPGAPPLLVELWPGTTEQRLELQLSAVLGGVVVDQNGAPMPNTGVRFVPDVPNVAFAGRRVLAGGPLSLAQAVTTGSDGSFVLEVATFGDGAVTALDGAADARSSVRTTVVKGRATHDLRIRANRR